MRILIVEDNEISAGILDANLRQRNYDTVVARTGKEALQMLQTYWDICLVLTDIMMPGMSGLDLVRAMRADQKLQEIPVIICTSVADSEHVAQAARLGCRHYLLKPVDRVQLLMMTDKILSGQRPIPVIGDRSKISAKYALSAQSLDRVFNAFAQLVDETLAVLSAPPDAADIASRLNLARLAEGAVTLGAERLLIPLQSLLAKGADVLPTLEERNTLAAELRWVQRALRPQTPADPPATECAASAGGDAEARPSG